MNHPLKNALPIVAAAYGEKFGVKVLIQGQDAYTDGENIVIPAANPDNPRFQQVAWGYLAHEAAHIRHTDFDVVAEAASHPLRKALLNIIEDIRIESALAQNYPGTRRTIHEVLRYMVDHQQLRVPTDNHPATLLQSWLLFRLRSRLLGQSILEPLYQVVDAQFSTQLPATVLSRLTVIVDAIQNLASTTDALQSADAIIQLFEEFKEDAEQIPRPAGQHGAPATGDEPDTSATNEESSQTSPDNGTQDDSLPHEPGSSSVDQDTSSADHDDSVVKQILSAGEGAFTADLFTQIATLLQAEAQQHQGAMAFNMPRPELAQPGDPDILQRTAGESARVRARLRGLVQSSQDNRPHAKHQGRQIDHNRLARSRTGESRLFLTRSNRVAPNAAVHLLVDVSGSMAKTSADSGRKYYQIANEAALALTLALEGIPGVSTAVSFFPGCVEDVAMAVRPRQSVRREAARFAQTPRGCTPLAPAMWFAANDLLRQKEKRKLIIVLTDGEPDDWNAAHDIVNRCHRSGFELLGIGIQTRSVERFFPSSLVINDLTDLQRELFNVTKNLLLTP
ncbi:VWA domain-containing protein [Marinobacterium rhizophilum]|uniref:VWA domain-containing protein n=1 Tax=Marinobacterium rhizophilum TaxID=420402 RepID=A0ABY5HL75_9GAMM|nr:VWA domain-containing protein [Marinobacterium rhizophilum]UTW11975.1 VWA domain-containing protein [Marinobacterium rhizophilum]